MRALLRIVAAVAAACVVAPTAAPAAQPTIRFRVFANTGHKMNGIVWTGTQWLFVENTKNTVWAAPAAGAPVSQFASMPNLVEETRCILSPGTHGYPPGAIFCHSPDKKIYEISADGADVRVFATLPAPAEPASDGALTFDDVGHFGYELVAATGRSGANQAAGGLLFTIGPSGEVRQVGSYPGPSGADEIRIAPASFGSAAGDALLTVDAGPDQGALVAMDATGATHTLAQLPGGPNPIAAIPRATRAKGQPPAGLYVTNDINPYVYFAPAAEFAPYAGDVIIGTEDHAQFWIFEPRGEGFVKIPIRTTLRGGHYSLEDCVFLS